MKNQVITLSKTACNKLKEIALTNNCKSILFYVKGGGCNGFNYKFEPTNEEPQKLDAVISRPGYDIQVCNKSLLHLLGTHIDWKKDIMGESFTLRTPWLKQNVDAVPPLPVREFKQKYKYWYFCLNAKKKHLKLSLDFLIWTKKMSISGFFKILFKKEFFFFKKMGLDDNGLISIFKQEKMRA